MSQQFPQLHICVVLFPEADVVAILSALIIRCQKSLGSFEQNAKMSVKDNFNKLLSFSIVIVGVTRYKQYRQMHIEDIYIQSNKKLCLNFQITNL
jgi:hypothetical protein